MRWSSLRVHHSSPPRIAALRSSKTRRLRSKRRRKQAPLPQLQHQHQPKRMDHQDDSALEHCQYLNSRNAFTAPLIHARSSIHGNGSAPEDRSDDNCMDLTSSLHNPRPSANPDRMHARTLLTTGGSGDTRVPRRSQACGPQYRPRRPPARQAISRPPARQRSPCLHW